MAKEEKKEELLLSYTRLYQQPHVFQQIPGVKFLEHAMRVSTLLYGGGIFLVVLLFVWQVLRLKFGLGFALGLFSGYFGGVMLSELKPEGKNFPIYIKDKVIYRLKHRQKGYWYKGEFVKESDDEMDIKQFEALREELEHENNGQSA
jgi:hypothetical protein